MKERRSFPLHPWRLLAFIIAWNVLILFDRKVLGVAVFGPFSLLVLVTLAALGFTAPAGRWPGRWLVRRQDFAHRWRWIFWLWALAGVLAAAMAVAEVLTLLQERASLFQ